MPVSPISLSRNQSYRLSSLKKRSTIAQAKSASESSKTSHATDNGVKMSQVDPNHVSLESTMSNELQWAKLGDAVYGSGVLTHNVLSASPVQPAWKLMPLNSSPSCEIDVLLGELVTIGRKYESQDLRFPEFVDRKFPSVASLLIPEQPSTQAASANQPNGIISSILVGHVTMSMALKSKVGEFASVWTLFNLLRWKMCQSEDTFEAIPDFLRPTPMQVAVAHPAFMDTYPWPLVRDRLITCLDPKDYKRFRRMVCESFTIHWPFAISQCVIGTIDGGYTLSPHFQRHLRSLDNWALTKGIVEEFPFLKGAVNVSDDKLADTHI
jgi:hypothetical protein